MRERAREAFIFGKTALEAPAEFHFDPRHPAKQGKQNCRAALLQKEKKNTRSRQFQPRQIKTMRTNLRQ